MCLQHSRTVIIVQSYNDLTPERAAPHHPLEDVLPAVLFLGVTLLKGEGQELGGSEEEGAPGPGGGQGGPGAGQAAEHQEVLQGGHRQ